MLDKIRQHLQSSDPALEAAVSGLHNGTLSPQAFLFYVQHHHGVRILDETSLLTHLAGIPQLERPKWENEPPLVSFIIPTYNRSAMLCEAVDSILAQDYPHLEILIIDDGSPDDTQRVVAQRYGPDPRIRYFRNQQNLHAGPSRQRGYQLAAGEYLVFLDDDDYYVDHDFTALAILEHLNNPNLSFVCANALFHYTQTEKVEISSLSFYGTRDSGEYLEKFQRGYKKPPIFSSVFRKEILEQGDLESMTMMNDGPIYLRALLFGEVCSLPQVVGVYRLHGENITYHLTAEFIMANLAEKAWVQQRAVERGLLKDGAAWLYDQLLLTLHYYIYESRPSYGEMQKVEQWLKDNTGPLASDLTAKLKGMWLRSQITKPLRPLKNLLRRA